MRRRIGIAVLVAAGLFNHAAAWAADQYAIDEVHTTVGFSVPHLVISRVHGNFRQLSGAIVYDETDVTKSSVNVTIKASSIDTGNEKRDQHLRSPDFFDAEKYPELTFKSGRIERQGDGYLCVGTLSLHGVSKEIHIPFTITGKVRDPWGKTRIAIEASLTLNPQDYGVSWNKTMETGGVLVGDEIKIELNVEAIQQEAAGAAS